MLMHLDLDCRFGLIYMINTMRKKNAFPSVNNTSYIIMHTLNIMSNEMFAFLFKARPISLIFILHHLKKKRKKEH